MRHLLITTFSIAAFTFSLAATATGQTAPPSVSSQDGKKHCSKAEMEKCKRAEAEAAASMTPEPSTVPASRVSFFEVGLVCKAAPKIGCGSKAKPVLLVLSANSRVAGAWLNEAGTRLAIGWKEGATPLTSDQLDAVLDPHGVALQAVSHEMRDELRASFASNAGWLDAASVGRLSEQEAGIIAARLVRRILAKSSVDSQQAESLRVAFEQSFLDRFKGNATTAEIADELVRVATTIVDAPTLAAVRDVVALGYRPLANEE